MKKESDKSKQNENFEVKKSPIDGLGLFTLRSLAARLKIGEMTGKRVSVRAARAKARQHRRLAIVELGDGTAIDAMESTDSFRYINHSCEPNSFMRVSYGHVGFYALRDIGPGEEITCAYGRTHHEGTLKCKCGNAKCRGYL
jgi:uncharacterized protein